jgi:hypothetical protein
MSSMANRYDLINTPPKRDSNTQYLEIEMQTLEKTIGRFERLRERSSSSLERLRPC